MRDLIPCPNCYGTGTVFPGKSFAAKSKRCPMCKGACKVPHPNPPMKAKK